MDEDAPHRMRWPRVLARVAAYTLLAGVLYVLSLGPACYLFFQRNAALSRASLQFYSPIYWLYEKTDFMAPVSQYELWWWSLPGGPIDRVKVRYGNPEPL